MSMPQDAFTGTPIETLLLFCCSLLSSNWQNCSPWVPAALLWCSNNLCTTLKSASLFIFLLLPQTLTCAIPSEVLGTSKTGPPPWMLLEKYHWRSSWQGHFDNSMAHPLAFNMLFVHAYAWAFSWLSFLDQFLNGQFGVLIIKRICLTITIINKGSQWYVLFCANALQWNCVLKKTPDRWWVYSSCLSLCHKWDVY